MEGKRVKVGILGRGQHFSSGGKAYVVHRTGLKSAMVYPYNESSEVKPLHCIANDTVVAVRVEPVQEPKKVAVEELKKVAVETLSKGDVFRYKGVDYVVEDKERFFGFCNAVAATDPERPILFGLKTPVEVVKKAGPVENDYTLLRPFSKEYVKVNDQLWNGRTNLFYKAGPDVNGRILLEDAAGEYTLSPSKFWAMLPLFWKDGVPVYAGDTLYDCNGSTYLILDNIEGAGSDRVLARSGATQFTVECTKKDLYIKHPGVWKKINPMFGSDKH